MLQNWKNLDFNYKEEQKQHVYPIKHFISLYHMKWYRVKDTLSQCEQVIAMQDETFAYYTVRQGLAQCCLP